MSDFKLINGLKPINPLLRLYYRRAMVHTFTNVCKSNACKFTDIWHENQTTSTGNTTAYSRCCSAFVFATRGIIHLACGDRKSRWCHARRNLLAFQNKSDLFSEIWELAKPNIDELETEYQAKFPDDPLSVLREILIYVLEATVTEERRRLLLEIIFHKCEFVGEMASVQLAQRHLCIENYDRIEQTLRHCMDANMLPENLNTRRVAVLLRSYITGIIENWLFAPNRLI